MAFQIPNILGNLGHAEQGMGSLTSGVENLQRVEIQKRIQDLQRDKAWERDDRLRNEKETLEMMDIPKADFVTKTEIDKFAKGQQDYTQFITDLNKQKKGKLDINDKIAIMQKKNELVGAVMRGKAFRDSFTEYQKNIIKTRSTLKDPDAKAEFDAQQAVLAKKMADPNYEPSPYDLIEAQQVPEPSFRITLAETAKDLLPFVDSAVVDAGNGRTVVDRNKLMQVIQNKVSDKDYLYSKGTEEGKVKTIDELYNQLADYIEPSIKTNVTPWKPDQVPESERVSGFEGRMTSSVNAGETVDAYVFDKTKPFEGSYTPTGATKPTSGKITPLGIRSDGKFEAEITVNKEVPSEPMSYAEATLQANQTKGRVSKSPDGTFRVISTQPVKETNIIPLSGDLAEKLRRADPKAAAYIDKLNPYPKRTGAKTTYSEQQESGISKVMKANGISREEAVNALKAANKLK